MTGTFAADYHRDMNTSSDSPALTEIARKLTRQAAANGDIKGAQKLGWVEDFERVCLHVATSAEVNEDTRAIFWIRLHGVLCEIFDLSPELLKSIEASGYLSAAEMRLFYAARSAWTKLVEVLSDDEHVLADYMRQTQVHVLQAGYDLRPINKKGGELVGINDQRPIRSLGRRLTLAEVKQACARLGVWKKISERDYAVLIARKLAPFVTPFREAMERFNRPPNEPF